MEVAEIEGRGEDKEVEGEEERGQESGEELGLAP